MDQIVGIVLPVFGLIGIGYVVAWSGLLDERTGDALADFVFAVAIPVLIFRTIAAADFSGGAPWLIWLPYYSAFVVMWIAGQTMTRRLFKRDHRAGLVGGISAAYGNTVLVGLPLALAAYGDDGAVVFALIIALHLPVMMGASAVMIGRAERLDGVASSVGSGRDAAINVARSLATNPIIIGIVVGALWRLGGLPLTGLVGTLTKDIAGVAGPLALLAMGMTLRRYGIRRNVPAGLALAVLKLMVMPALVLLFTRFVAMPPVWAKVAVVAAACPTGVNSYLVASRFRTGEALASNAIALSSGLAVLSTAFWLQVVEWVYRAPPSGRCRRASCRRRGERRGRGCRRISTACGRSARESAGGDGTSGWVDRAGVAEARAPTLHGIDPGRAPRTRRLGARRRRQPRDGTRLASPSAR